MPSMNTKVVFQIGSETSPQDKPPFRVFVYWLSQGKLLRVEDFSEKELGQAIDIHRREQENDAETLTALEEALSALKRANH